MYLNMLHIYIYTCEGSQGPLPYFSVFVYCLLFIVSLFQKLNLFAFQITKQGVLSGIGGGQPIQRD